MRVLHFQTEYPRGHKDLHISEATIKTHLLHIFAKLGVDDRTAPSRRRWRRESCGW